MLRSRIGMKILPAGFLSAISGAFLCGLFATSCDDDKHSYVKNIGDGLSTPTMSTVNVETFISDSGYTRYHISTPTWLMYEEAPDPFWRFPDGLDLEQYDLRMRVSATISCDSARYLSQRRIWRLDGNVVMVNVLRDSFLTQQVFWDQNRRQVYSDSFIHIVRANRIIEGYGFRSNENITEYTVNNPTAIIPIDRRQPGIQSQESDNDLAVADSAAPQERRANARRRANAQAEPTDEPARTSEPAVLNKNKKGPLTAKQLKKAPAAKH